MAWKSGDATATVLSGGFFLTALAWVNTIEVSVERLIWNKEMVKKTPSATEMVILDTLVSTGPATVQQIRDALPDHRKLAHTTVITILQRLEEKDLVQHEKAQQGKSFLFAATRPMENVKRHLVLDFMQDFFSNDPIPLVSSLIHTKRITHEELEQLRDIIDNAELEKEA
jgi:BlaI family transcriptional regulator, penicillinase repressor